MKKSAGEKKQLNLMSNRTCTGILTHEIPQREPQARVMSGLILVSVFGLWGMAMFEDTLTQQRIRNSVMIYEPLSSFSLFKETRSDRFVSIPRRGIETFHQGQEDDGFGCEEPV